MPTQFAYWPGSAAEKRLKAIARRLGGSPAPRTDFYGILFGNRRVLYRHAQYMILTVRGHQYERIEWTNPFGAKDQLRGVDYVLLHAREPREAFYLFPAARAKALARQFPTRLNVGADPARKNVESSEAIDRYLISLRDLRKRFGR